MHEWVHIFAATALGRGREASTTLGRFYSEKAQVLVLQEAERAPFVYELDGPCSIPGGGGVQIFYSLLRV